MDWFSFLVGLILGLSIGAFLVQIVREDGRPEFRPILLILTGLMVVLSIIQVYLQILRMKGI